jgi:hypothetical protein
VEAALVPYPPRFPPGDLPPLTPTDVKGSWRLQGEGNPLHPKRYASGRWRFDAPDGSWPVTYFNQTELGAFAEAFGNRGEIGPGDRDRRLIELSSTRPLNLIRLSEPDVLARLELDANIATTLAYDRTMRWGERLRAWYPEGDGIEYTGRRSASHVNTCVWLDRCADALTSDESGPLKNQRSRVMRICDRLGLAPRLFEDDEQSGPPWPGL